MAGRNVTCNHCHRTYVLEEAVQERPVEGTASVVETGVVCPHCQMWTHAFYMNAALRNARALVDRRRQEVADKKPGALDRYKKAKKQYQRQFDRMNAYLREKYGGVSPAELASS